MVFSSSQKKFLEIKSVINKRACLRSIFVNKLSKSHDDNFESDGKIGFSVICIKFCESKIKVIKLRIKGCKIRSIKREIREVGCDLQLIIGLRPNLDL